jgi:hypothetical protein
VTDFGDREILILQAKSDAFGVLRGVLMLPEIRVLADGVGFETDVLLGLFALVWLSSPNSSPI